MSLALVIAFAAVVLLLALALVWSPWPRWTKGVLVAAVAVLYFWGHDTVQALLGVPSTAALPERFVMVAAKVDEPTASNKGALYLWVLPMRDGVAQGEPRAYRLPYTRGLHEQIDMGLKKGREGVSQMGTAEVKEGRGKGGGWLQPGLDEQEVKIRDLPQPQLPEK